MTDEGSPDRLRRSARVALAAGAVASVGFMLASAARRHPPPLLVALFVVWMLAPYAALALGQSAARHWSAPTRTTLHALTIVIALGSIGVLGADAIWPPRSTAAFVYVATPLAAWLLMAVVIPAAALIARRRATRSSG